MAIERITRPYEFLVRWGPAGIAGAHVQFIDEIVEDGKVLSATPGDALPVSMAGSQGFPLKDILDQQQADALSTVTTLHASVDQLTAENRTMANQTQDLLAEFEGLKARHAEAQSTIADLRGRVAELEGAA